MGCTCLRGAVNAHRGCELGFVVVVHQPHPGDPLQLLRGVHLAQNRHREFLTGYCFSNPHHSVSKQDYGPWEFLWETALNPALSSRKDKHWGLCPVLDKILG